MHMLRIKDPCKHQMEMELQAHIEDNRTFSRSNTAVCDTLTIVRVVIVLLGTHLPDIQGSNPNAS